jgi:hypothetical protein
MISHQAFRAACFHHVPYELKRRELRATSIDDIAHKKRCPGGVSPRPARFVIAQPRKKSHQFRVLSVNIPNDIDIQSTLLARYKSGAAVS